MKIKNTYFHILTFFCLFMMPFVGLYGQSADCADALQLCPGSTPTPNVAAEIGTSELNFLNDGCLAGENGSNWYWFEIDATGDLWMDVQGVQSDGTTAADVDVSLYGPFATFGAGCTAISGGNDPIRCSFAACCGVTMDDSTTETSESASGDGTIAELTVTSGDIYLLFVDNYNAGDADAAITIDLAFTGSSATFNCPPPCDNCGASTCNSDGIYDDYDDSQNSTSSGCTPSEVRDVSTTPSTQTYCTEFTTPATLNTPVLAFDASTRWTEPTAGSCSTSFAGETLFDAACGGSIASTGIDPNSGFPYFPVMANTTYRYCIDWTYSGTCMDASNPCIRPFYACGAEAGTVASSSTGMGTGTTVDPYVLCIGDEVSLESNDDYVLPAPFPGEVSELFYAIYSCAPTTGDPGTDPCFSGSYWSGEDFVSAASGGGAGTLPVNTAGSASGLGSFLDADNTLWLVPITADDSDNAGNPNGIINHDQDGDGCFDEGTPIAVQFLEEITATFAESCPDLSVTISGGDSQFNGTDYTISAISPGGATVVGTPSHGNAFTITGIPAGSSWSFTATDANGCSVDFASTVALCPPVTCPPEYNNIEGNTYCQNDPSSLLQAIGLDNSTFVSGAFPSGGDVNSFFVNWSPESVTPGYYFIFRQDGVNNVSWFLNDVTSGAQAESGSWDDVDGPGTWWTWIEYMRTDGADYQITIQWDTQCEWTGDVGGTGFDFLVYDLATDDFVEGHAINSCTGTVTIDIPEPQGTAVFSGPGVTQFDNGTGFFDPEAAGPGTHDIQYLWEDGNGCGGTETKTVTVYPRNEPSFVDDFGCVINMPDNILAFDASGTTVETGGTITSYDWDFGDGNTGTGITANNTYAAPGAYLVELTVTSTPGPCVYTKEEIVYVYPDPTLAMPGGDICLGDSYTLTPSITPPAPAPIPTIETVKVANLIIPDVGGVPFESTINVTDFPPGATITSTADLAVLINFEHSYLADLDIELICPDGTTMLLFDQASSDGNNYDMGGATTASNPPGPGADYIFAESGTQTLAVATNGSPGAVASGTFDPEPGDFSSLIGCPINGDWTIRFTDLWARDDGTLYNWSLTLPNSMIGAPSTFQPTYNTIDYSFYNVGNVAGNGLTAMNDLTMTGNFSGAATAMVTPSAVGSYDYTVRIRDNRDCYKEVTATVNVFEGVEPLVDDSDCSSGLTASILEQNATDFTYSYSYNYTVDGGSTQSGTGSGSSFTLPESEGAASGTITFTVTNPGAPAACNEQTIIVPINCALPVELLDFTGYANGAVNDLKWTTATEINNSHFEIESSKDGLNFRNIGTVEGNGNSSIEIEYDFTDERPHLVTYYRLKQVDFDGTFSYSDVIKIVRKTTSIAIENVFPSPTRGNTTVQFIGARDAEVTISVIDVVGRTHSSQLFQAIEGENQTEIDFSSFASGIYFIMLETNDQRDVWRIVKH